MSHSPRKLWQCMDCGYSFTGHGGHDVCPDCNSTCITEGTILGDPMKRMYILVGPPGCGKSHITGMINEAVGPLAVCSADHFFEQDGVYRFNPTLLHSAHRDCQNRALKAVDQGYGTVVIDNTATRHKERKYYLALAEQYNYIPVVVSFPETGHTNIHGVPAEKVKEMRDRMDLNPGVYLWSTATGYLHAQDFDEFVLKIRESISHIARGRS